jgi:hypothetical protein
MADIKDGNKHVACLHCRYYQVTYDFRQPYGCRAHGFKSPRNPSLIVYESSGIECQLFEPRNKNEVGHGLH